MMTATKDNAEELSYSVYDMRQRDEVQKTTLEMRASLLSQGHKFRYQDGAWTPVSYPGVSVVSMVDYDGDNMALHASLCDIQSRLEQEAGLPSALYMLPPDSFHQTVANTFSADRYEQHIVRAGLVDTYPQLLQRAFEEIHVVPCEKPIEMRLIGLSLFRTAIGLLGVFPDVQDFERVLQFRNGLYGHSDLQAIGLQCTRPFIGHITLAYIEGVLSDASCRRLVDVIAELNAEIEQSDLTFRIYETEPRWYDHLASFEKRPDYPLYSFV